MNTYSRRFRSLAPAIALAAMLLVVVIFENTVPTTLVHPYEENWMDCYCHKKLKEPIYVNGTEIDLYLPRVQEGKSFALRVEVIFDPTSEVAQNIVTWIPDTGDNSKFTFDPAQVGDNSPQDQNPTPGTITALFRITAPNQSGEKSIILSYLAYSSTIALYVVGGEGVSQSYAAIAKVDSPKASMPGDIVRVNVTLQNNGTKPNTLYVYATNGSTPQIVFDKVYSESVVPANGTITLSGVFPMPNGSLAMTMHSGHNEDNVDVDDSRFTVYVFQSMPVPPVERALFGVLAMEWAPWIALVAASLGSVPLVGVYARRGKPLSSKAEKLKLAVVECTRCALCKTAMGDFEKSARNYLGNVALEQVTAKDQGPVDVAVVLGSIRTAEDAQAVKEARENAKLLVAFGACSIFGMWSPDHRRRVDADARGLRNQISTEGVSKPTDPVRPVSDYVKVDLSIPGCPPPMQVMLNFILTEFKKAGVDAPKRIGGMTERGAVGNV